MKRVHMVCHYIKKLQANERTEPPEPDTKCRECPAREKVGSRTGTKICRLIAQQVMDIATTGNPWGKRGIVHRKAKSSNPKLDGSDK